MLCWGVRMALMQFEARRTFIGPTDPATGYRYTFTVAQGWEKASVHREEDLGLLVPRLDVEGFGFQVPKPGPVQAWLDAHLWHPAPPPFEMISDIRVGRPAYWSGSFRLDIVSTIKEQQHLRISDQPATWVVMRNEIPTNAFGNGAKNIVIYSYSLEVEVQGQLSGFFIEGNADEAHKDQVRREVRAIGDSFRIEKVGKPLPPVPYVPLFPAPEWSIEQVGSPVSPAQ